jgi:hypothetical protein
MKRPFVILCCVCAAWCLATIARAAEGDVRRLARLDHPPMSEISGLARSHLPGVFWAHNDSGDEPRLFAVTLDGTPVVPEYLKRRYSDGSWPGLRLHNAANVDWEDMAAAADMLYLADVGNNGNARRDLGVYYLPEPNPAAVAESRALGFWPIRYPDQETFPAEHWHFDCEAVFVADGKLHFLTKHRRPNEQTGWEPGTNLYRLDTAYTDAVNALTWVSRRDDVILPTAAEVSPDGNRLAVLTYVGTWVFERPAGADWLGGDSAFYPIPRDVAKINEAVAWKDDTHLLIANEDRDLLELEVRPPPVR